MARTVRDLITDALRDTGAIGAIETPEPEEIAHGLLEFNNLVSQLDLDNLVPYSNLVTTGSLVSGKELYSVGSGADIDITRPNEIVTFAVEVGGVFKVMQQYTPVAFDNESILSGLGSIPAVYVYRTDFPNGTLQVYPIPSSDYNFKMTSRVKSIEYGLNDELLLPSGYYPMYQKQLALLLLIAYPNPEKYTIVEKVATEMLARIKRQNSKPSKLKNDYSANGGYYDVRSDSYIR